MNAIRLKELRIAAHKSQQDIADTLGIDRTTYAKYESGSSNPNVARLTCLAEYFGVSTSYLVGDSDLTFHELTDLENEVLMLLAKMSPEIRKAAVAQLKILAALNK